MVKNKPSFFRNLVIQRERNLAVGKQFAPSKVKSKSRFIIKRPLINREAQVIPDTNGNVPMRRIHNEIDIYANEVP